MKEREREGERERERERESKRDGGRERQSDRERERVDGKIERETSLKQSIVGLKPKALGFLKRPSLDKTAQKSFEKMFFYLSL